MAGNGNLQSNWVLEDAEEMADLSKEGSNKRDAGRVGDFQPQDAVVIRTFGREGDGEGEFNHPSFACFIETDQVLLFQGVSGSCLDRFSDVLNRCVCVHAGQVALGMCTSRVGRFVKGVQSKCRSRTAHDAS